MRKYITTVTIRINTTEALENTPIPHMEEELETAIQNALEVAHIYADEIELETKLE